ncbi:MAG: flagellar biosynthesis repressor FlbT [Alphaproteobacteria bacterium]|nr:flagellar biosynthesis repressor FlbT [Alphaproteobacteria bacterium]
MSTLVLEPRQGDMMMVNGAPIRFRNRARIELTARARFLFGKQLMTPDMANTPARCIYFALQTAYIDDHEERKAGLEHAKQLITEFRVATTSNLARKYLDRALALAEEDQCYQALKFACRVMRHEEVVLGMAPIAQFATATE